MRQSLPLSINIMLGLLCSIIEVKSHSCKASKFLKAVCQINGNFSKSISTMSDVNIDNSEPPNKILRSENGLKEIHEDKLKADKIKFRNVALLLAYNGKNYYGMQVNSNFKTIESELLTALFKANAIREENMTNLHTIHFQRAARTDKGVSAAKQVVSLKIAENYNIDTINSYLPKDIKVFSIKRVTKGFNSKNFCLARTYSYTLPSFALAPEFHHEYPSSYRIDQETIQKVSNILESFLGTHCFHNFTCRKDSRDPSAKRYIYSFIVEEPFLKKKEEFVTLKIKGQSFMLHQIRKMIGYIIAVMKNILSETAKLKVWSSDKISVPMAPGLGLVLEELHYDKYNKKYGSDGVHVSLTWDEMNDELKVFRENCILENIVQTELEEKSMFNWIQDLTSHEWEGGREPKEEIAEMENCDTLSKVELQSENIN